MDEECQQNVYSNLGSTYMEEYHDLRYRRRHLPTISTIVYCLQEHKSLKASSEHQKDVVVWHFDDDVTLRLRRSLTNQSCHVGSNKNFLKLER